MKKQYGLYALMLTLVLGCGGGKVNELQTKNEDLAKRISKLEDDLHQTKRQLIAQEQSLQAVNERLKDVEAGIDKLAYGSSTRR